MTKSLNDMCLRKVNDLLPTPSCAYNSRWEETDIVEYDVLRTLPDSLLQAIAKQKVERALEQPMVNIKERNGFEAYTALMSRLREIDFLKPHIEQAIKDQEWVIIDMDGQIANKYINQLRRKTTFFEECINPSENPPATLVVKIFPLVKGYYSQLEPSRYLVPITASGYSMANLWLNFIIGNLTKDEIKVEIVKEKQALTPGLSEFFTAASMMAPHQNGTSIQVTGDVSELEKRGIVVAGRLRHIEVENARKLMLLKAHAAESSASQDAKILGSPCTGICCYIMTYHHSN